MSQPNQGKATTQQQQSMHQNTQQNLQQNMNITTYLNGLQLGSAIHIGGISQAETKITYCSFIEHLKKELPLSKIEEMDTPITRMFPTVSFVKIDGYLLSSDGALTIEPVQTTLEQVIQRAASTWRYELRYGYFPLNSYSGVVNSSVVSGLWLP